MGQKKSVGMSSSSLLKRAYLNISSFLALNPRGTLDFALPSEGNISTYFGELSCAIYPLFGLLAILFRYGHSK